jgi:plastocyanin
VPRTLSGEDHRVSIVQFQRWKWHPDEGEQYDMSSDSRRLNRRQFSVTAAATAATIAAATTTIEVMASQEATPVAGDVATPVNAPASDVEIQVVVTGLQDPRFVATDGDAVYFTESGFGGDTEVFPIPGEGTPEPGSAVSHRGTTGRLSRLAPDGSVEVVADGFQSYTFGGNGEIVGAAGIALDGAGKAYIAVGAPGPFVSNIELTGAEDALIEVDLATGEKRVVANLAQYEIANDPDPMTIDSNLYGAAYREGVVYIADSGGNSILAVDVASGEITTFAVPGGIEAPFLPEAGNPLRQGELAIDAVPSGIVLGPDDRFYVTYITGGPFPIGFARVDAFTISGDRADFATGLTMVSDVAFSSDGTAYAVVMSSDFLNGGPGQIVRLSEDGLHSVVVDGLQMPNGIAFDANDILYVTHKVSLAPIGGGELLRISGLTTTAGTPLSAPVESESVNATPAADTGAFPTTVHVELGDMYFEPSEITIRADSDVLFTFENVGYLQHDFYVAEVDIFSGVLGGGQSAEMLVNIPAGTYEFWCTQVGHRSAGMMGKIIVE